ncbi:Kef-type potassium/proton antiporter, CPA2 family [Nitrosomonas eutropha]|uniref:cation:proton antiporter domain-containing protein n=1 Tax=Nitrosomonas eutropha TaxID=916 RepID=UPI000890C309|nr:cation:proton antiporter [Nitrosomonas eutropha]SCX23723.1 Kef-type potassium/proton antiporter, CPA2 family [Nitrosomonas eutropha]
MMEYLVQIILLLAVAITVVVVFQRLHIPTSLGYLLVGILLGPHTAGPVVSMPGLESLAEFGVVFLLFTIGLNFSLPQMDALRTRVLGLGTGQVVLTTLVVGVVTWLAGLPIIAAFVFGAVFAQSSTTIIASLLTEQGEVNTPHGRLGLAMSVFQDVTAVPFLVVIPVLGVSVAADVLAGSLALAFAKAVLAFILVFIVGRWLLSPFFQIISERRSVEVFTLAVLLVALFAAWITNSLGLSLAFGGFLAGLVLGKTEFRHQVESSISPFRDVLLGLFFIGIGMRFNPVAIPPIWQWTLLGALLILISKILIVAALVRGIGVDARMMWRTGLMLSVGGEFGLALIAIALDSGVIDIGLGQIAISSVLLSMVLGAVLIRFNDAIATFLTKTPPPSDEEAAELPQAAERSVIIGGYGRMGRTIAILLHACGIPFVAFDTDPRRVALGRADRHAVWLGDIADPILLASIRVERASLIVLAVDIKSTALSAMIYIKRTSAHVPVIVRVRDLETSRHLLAAGAAHAYPETIESSLSLGVTALRMLNVAADEIEEAVQNLRNRGYQPVVEDEKKKL